jgi:hypothetical protein
MGGSRTGAETPAIASPAAGAAGTGERENLPGARRRWGALGAYLLAGAMLFAAYLRLSETSQLNSDSANILLMGSDLLHGHLLLHGWYMSDVSFYPTELPQYALLESFLGLKMQTAHVAAAMTYTLAFLLAVLLARSGSSGRAAWARTLIAAGVMLAPQFGPASSPSICRSATSARQSRCCWSGCCSTSRRRGGTSRSSPRSCSPGS